MTADPYITLFNGGTPSTTYITVKSGKPLFEYKFWILAKTVSGKTANIYMLISVCGYESVVSRTD